MGNYFVNGNTEVSSISHEYLGINNPHDLYMALSHCWSIETCAPRMRDKWSKENYTCGQCSITAFLFQDIFGGEVFGVALGDGNYHCYNVINDSIFDLTSEQFGDTKLSYDSINPQSREVHFMKQEKYERYLLLKKKLKEYLNV